MLPLTTRALLLLGIGDPSLVVGLLALTGFLHLTRPVALVLILVGILLNGMALVEIVKGGGVRRPGQ